MTTTSDILDTLRTYESRNVTYFDPAGGWPIVWARAKGNWVWDVEGRKYLDLTGAFGVAAAGHANPRVVAAAKRQLSTLVHAMGDVHPHAPKAELAKRLSQLTFERWSPGETGKVTFCNSGFEAVEAALKTALLATGKPGIICFAGAYHGLGYGALNVVHREYFRGPFASQLREFGHFLPYPARVEELTGLRAQLIELASKHPCGAILVEPIQARAGTRVPPAGFLRLLRQLADELGLLLLLDEIYTGFGRTGTWFACEAESVVPDVICLGKAITGGFPLSACVGRASVMDRAWPASPGEAMHTSTYLGHPVGCAMALAQIAEIERLKLPEAAAEKGAYFMKLLRKLRVPATLRAEVRGRGLMVGLELSNADGSPAGALVIDLVKRALSHGLMLLPEADAGNVIGFTPPLTLTREQLRQTVQVIQTLLNEPTK